MYRSLLDISNAFTLKCIAMFQRGRACRAVSGLTIHSDHSSAKEHTRCLDVTQKGLVFIYVA